MSTIRPKSKAAATRSACACLAAADDLALAVGALIGAAQHYRDGDNDGAVIRLNGAKHMMGIIMHSRIMQQLGEKP